MALRFSRLKSEMLYFENADTLRIESVLDLMFDLYSDVEEGIGIGPEDCGCDDSDSLTENLIWMGTVFQNICRNYRKDIASSSSSNQNRLTGICADLDRELRVLLEQKNTYEKMKERVVALQKEKRTLEGELSQCREKQPELKALENRVAQLKKEHEKAGEIWKKNQDACRKLEKEIMDTTGEINELDNRIRDELTPRMNELTNTLTERRNELKSLNTKIQFGDEQSQQLKEQIEKLKRDIGSSDQEGILLRLQEQQSALEKEKNALAELVLKIEQCEKDILAIRERQLEKNNKLDEKRREKEMLHQELEQLEGVFEDLCANRLQYNKLRRRYNSLKMIADQLRKDGAILCKRTGMEAFSLEDDLDRGMNAIGTYLSGIAAAIDQYSRQAEDSL